MVVVGLLMVASSRTALWNSSNRASIGNSGVEAPSVEARPGSHPNFLVE